MKRFIQLSNPYPDYVDWAVCEVPDDVAPERASVGIDCLAGGYIHTRDIVARTDFENDDQEVVERWFVDDSLGGAIDIDSHLNHMVSGYATLADALADIVRDASFDLSDGTAVPLVHSCDDGRDVKSHKERIYQLRRLLPGIDIVTTDFDENGAWREPNPLDEDGAPDERSA